MNRFVQNRSLVFFIATWACIVALGADFANVDDLISSDPVLHDDQDVLAGPLQTARTPDHLNPVGPVTVPHARLYAIVDQDSPSLAADVAGFELAVLDLPMDPVHQVRSAISSNDELFLWHRTLLI
jgi:hypothetical protein